ncbi:MAG: LPXTG cell wall anchor domain-containing protein, partial [Oscillospiraceae bacterium]|nr:LPXTG cell wall anchor domain-containing protein [Oscillospiraceae bacterium]
LYKYNSDAAELANAKFTMKTPENADMYFIQKNAGDASTPAVYEFSSAYASATTGATNTITTPASGAVVIYGLDTGTYTLTETEAPSGYNQLTATVSVPVEYASEALSADKTFTTSKSKTATFVKGTDDTTSGTTYKLAANSVIGIENLTGTELPSTGGIGTTIFYVVGALLVVGAGVVLVTRRKVDDDR